MRPASFVLVSLLALAPCAFALPLRVEGPADLSEAPPPAFEPAAEALPLVAIQPLGDVDPTLIRATEQRLASTFAARVVVLPRLPLPTSAFYPPRRRYRGEKILDRLEASAPPGVTKVMGLMSRDLSATKGAILDWGVLGLAGLGRRAAVVSIHRLGRRGAPRRVVERRLEQVATHELGHTLGLTHCRTPRCVMNDACGTMRTVDRSSGSFCPACRARLGAMLRNSSEI